MPKLLEHYASKYYEDTRIPNATRMIGNAAFISLKTPDRLKSLL